MENAAGDRKFLRRCFSGPANLPDAVQRLASDSMWQFQRFSRVMRMRPFDGGLLLLLALCLLFDSDRPSCAASAQVLGDVRTLAFPGPRTDGCGFSFRGLHCVGFGANYDWTVFRTDITCINATSGAIEVVAEGIPQVIAPVCAYDEAAEQLAVFGGRLGFNNYANNAWFAPLSNSGRFDVFTEVNPPPKSVDARFYHSGVFLPSKRILLACFGSAGPETALDSCVSVDATRGAESVADFPVPLLDPTSRPVGRRNHAAAVVSSDSKTDKMFVVGGLASPYVLLADVLQLTVTTSLAGTSAEWQVLLDLPAPRAVPAISAILSENARIFLVVYGGNLVPAGTTWTDGRTTANDVYLFDSLQPAWRTLNQGADFTGDFEPRAWSAFSTVGKDFVTLCGFTDNPEFAVETAAIVSLATLSATTTSSLGGSTTGFVSSTTNFIMSTTGGGNSIGPSASQTTSENTAGMNSSDGSTFAASTTSGPADVAPVDTIAGSSTQASSEGSLIMIISIIAGVVVCFVCLALFFFIQRRQRRDVSQRMTVVASLEHLEQPYSALCTTSEASSPQTHYSAIEGSGGVASSHPGGNNVDRSGNYSSSRSSPSSPKLNSSLKEQHHRVSTVVADKWLIEHKELEFGREIGRGAFGVVYSGSWRTQECAIKQVVLPTDGNEEVHARALEDFLVEAGTMCNLRPAANVVQLFGVCIAPIICLVVEYCGGGSLRGLIDRDELTEISLALRIVRGIAKGMLHLELESVVHRDLACRNVLLTEHPQYQPKIADFGLARLQSSNEDANKTQSDVGPLRWMSPEAVLERRFSHKSDVWAFGVVLVEIFSGSKLSPFSDKAAPAVSALVASGRFKPSQQPLLLNPPPLITDILQRCSAFDAADRPSFRDICRTLETGSE